jgi:hypothetical protein
MQIHSIAQKIDELLTDEWINNILIVFIYKDNDNNNILKR